MTDNTKEYSKTQVDSNINSALTNFQKFYTLSSETSGDVINYNTLKTLIHNKIADLPVGTSIVNFNSSNQHGVFLVTKTTNELYSALYLTGYNRQITVFFQDGYIVR